MCSVALLAHSIVARPRFFSGEIVAVRALKPSRGATTTVANSDRSTPGLLSCRVSTHVCSTTPRISAYFERIYIRHDYGPYFPYLCHPRPYLASLHARLNHSLPIFCGSSATPSRQRHAGCLCLTLAPCARVVFFVCWVTTCSCGGRMHALRATRN